LKPYGNSNLTIKHSIFDSCLSTENVCGILVSRFCVWKGHKPDTLDLHVDSSFTIHTDDVKCPIMCVFYQDVLIPKTNAQMNYQNIWQTEIKGLLFIVVCDNY